MNSGSPARFLAAEVILWLLVILQACVVALFLFNEGLLRAIVWWLVRRFSWPFQGSDNIAEYSSDFLWTIRSLFALLALATREFGRQKWPLAAREELELTPGGLSELRRRTRCARLNVAYLTAVLAAYCACFTLDVRYGEHFLILPLFLPAMVLFPMLHAWFLWVDPIPRGRLNTWVCGFALAGSLMPLWGWVDCLAQIALLVAAPFIKARVAADAMEGDAGPQALARPLVSG